MVHSDVYERSFDEESGKTRALDTCPECEGAVRTLGGETTCSVCGIIIEEYRIDHSTEGYTSSEGRWTEERTGAPLTTTRHDRGLSSEIGWTRDGQGQSLPGKKRAQLSRLRRRHSRARWGSKAERNLAQACAELKRLMGALDLPWSICEEACLIYRRAQDADLITGRSIESIAAASLYAACRCRDHFRTLSEIAEASSCAKKKIRHGYRVLCAELALEVGIVTPHDHIPHIASTLNAAPEIRYRAIELANLAKGSGLANGRHPAGVAAACLYLASQECGTEYTQTAVAEAADVTPATLRTRCSELDALIADP